jgi:hypothetical protein
MKAELLDAKAMGPYFRRYNVSAQGSVVERADRLQAHFEVLQARGHVEIVRCDRCEGRSDRALPLCPFCGCTEPVIEKTATTVEPEAPAAESTELAPVPTGAIADLDLAVQELRGCVRFAVKNAYRMGQLLRRIRDEGLWQLRVDDDGLPKYHGFHQFVGLEIGVKHAYTNRLISVCEVFSEQDIEKFGITRLSVALRLTESERHKWLEDTQQLPARGPELAQAARKPSGATGFPEMNGRRVVARVPVGRVVVPMYQRPTVPTRVGAPTEMAQSFDQDPWTRIQLDKDLHLAISLKRARTGQIKAVVEIREGHVAAEPQGKS